MIFSFFSELHIFEKDGESTLGKGSILLTIGKDRMLSNMHMSQCVFILKPILNFHSQMKIFFLCLKMHFNFQCEWGTNPQNNNLYLENVTFFNVNVNIFLN